MYFKFYEILSLCTVKTPFYDLCEFIVTLKSHASFAKTCGLFFKPWRGNTFTVFPINLWHSLLRFMTSYTFWSGSKMRIESRLWSTLQNSLSSHMHNSQKHVVCSLGLERETHLQCSPKIFSIHYSVSRLSTLSTEKSAQHFAAPLWVCQENIIFTNEMNKRIICTLILLLSFFFLLILPNNECKLREFFWKHPAVIFYYRLSFSKWGVLGNNTS